ncbi:hypothetical protein [Paenibacillus agilis]|uniref:hypothetical protein n=1 Tax=Paenibacillus agilis TaxID=3020863 RepID=UPI001649CC73|nr:hypothetical protein [Paenibacillus agilis]
MMAIACAMGDEDNNGIDNSYLNYQKRCEMEGMIAMSEFEYINRVVVRNPPISFPQ